MPESRLLFDTDVLIDYLRGEPQAIAYLEERTEILMVSAVTIAELFAGVREGEERRRLNSFLRIFEVVDVSQQIAERGGLIRRGYKRSHNTSLPDAIIAATAELAPASLVTLNDKHFPMLEGVIVPYRKSSG
ncbi:type II toxin-antitoxin system VapC family toxin [Rubrobacter aplysinae]|uniref:type II toxin-antitoxin system VapC family toxin n=1 Tax=Rubrobacter aplysinae TaxID=909625 RepID=UPI00064C49DE|nr:type II toxin-antitoxin system VapC family toxin [Rubrobacter aplysinae]